MTEHGHEIHFRDAGHEGRSGRVATDIPEDLWRCGSRTHPRADDADRDVDRTPPRAGEGTFEPNPFVKIAPDNTVTVIIKHLDKGQGAATGLSALVAEELDASHEQIRTEFAPADANKYKNFAFGIQGVGGSTGLANSYEQYRKAGATARAMLVAAAAKAWGVDASTITVKGGVVSSSSGKSATFGDLAERAAAETVPADVH